MYIYILTTWAFASILFGATLWLRKIINDVEFGLGAMALSLLMVLITVLSQEVHIPSVSTQRLYIPCDPGGGLNARFLPTGDLLWVDRLDFSLFAQSILQRVRDVTGWRLAT